jgi:hypothetical protein
MDRPLVLKRLQESRNRSLHQDVTVEANDLIVGHFILVAGMSVKSSEVDFSIHAE